MSGSPAIDALRSDRAKWAARKRLEAEAEDAMREDGYRASEETPNPKPPQGGSGTAPAKADKTPLDFILRVLRATGEAFSCDDVRWRTDGEYAPVTFFVDCGDVFWWGTSDDERLTPENVGELERAYADTRAATGNTIYASTLFCCRVRKMRPQGAVYPDGDQYRPMWSLFDECGPERPKDVCNPYAPGERAERWKEAEAAKG